MYVHYIYIYISLHLILIFLYLIIFFIKKIFNSNINIFKKN